jgi:hypothetical protein
MSPDVSGLPAITVTDPLGGTRLAEPVEFTVPADLPGDVWDARTDGGDTVVCQVLTDGAAPGTTRFAAVLDVRGSVVLRLSGPSQREVPGIRRLAPRETDAFVRLDTGAFDLEMCRGTAGGTGDAKWGLRHFSSIAEGIDLLPSGNNAIGGFYGPFFTPENGLINPPEHTVVEIDTVESGPVQHHYRMRGTIPDGLLPELRGKGFSIDWVFHHGSRWFSRVYRVDDFETTINGRSVTNKITVGDEFESGHGHVVFDRFAARGGTRYRAGDPYAGELATMVADTLATSSSQTEKFTAFRQALTEDIETSHWDLYWRLFCSWEGALSESEIRQRLAAVRTAAHRLADLPQRSWQLRADAVDVSATEHQTVFAGPADQTVEYHSGTGRAMVWWTSAPSGAFQIVQRPQSGWVNWGTNGENECPELPVGVVVRTAYGQLADRWEAVADGLSTPLTWSTGPT